MAAWDVLFSGSPPMERRLQGQGHLEFLLPQEPRAHEFQSESISCVIRRRSSSSPLPPP